MLSSCRAKQKVYLIAHSHSHAAYTYPSIALLPAYYTTNTLHYPHDAVQSV